MIALMYQFIIISSSSTTTTTTTTSFIISSISSVVVIIIITMARSASLARPLYGAGTAPKNRPAE